MSHYVSIDDTDGNPFSHHFSNSDWSAIASLAGCDNDKCVRFSEGHASIDGGVVNIYIKASQGGRNYFLHEHHLFK